MPERVVYIPMNADLYDDIVRFSDGGLNPSALAYEQVYDFVARSVETVPEVWGDRLEEVAQIYAPDVWERWTKEDDAELSQRREESRPLVWKEVSIRAGSEVRMAYGDRHHYAKIQRGHIVDDGKEYSPSEWASKVAGNTSRNAWRDLWFKEPMSKTWVPAQLLRDQAKESQLRGETKLPSNGSDD